MRLVPWCRSRASTVSALPPDAEMPIATVSAEGGNGCAAEASSTCASMPRLRHRAAAVWAANCELPMPSSTIRRASAELRSAERPPGAA